MKRVFFILLALLFAASCDDEVTLVPSFEENGSVTVTSNGFSETIIIPGKEVRKTINDAKDEDGRIEMIVLEGLVLDVFERPENIATSMEINIGILAWDTNTYQPFLESFEVSIPEEDVAVLSNLQSSGVESLKTQLNQLASGTSSRDIEFVITGTVLPPSSVVKAIVEIWIRGSVVYIQLTK